MQVLASAMAAPARPCSRPVDALLPLAPIVIRRAGRADLIEPRSVFGRPRAGSGQQFVGQGVGHSRGAAGYFELGENVLDMVLGRAPADVEGLADLWVGG